MEYNKLESVPKRLENNEYINEKGQYCVKSHSLTGDGTWVRAYMVFESLEKYNECKELERRIHEALEKGEIHPHDLR